MEDIARATIAEVMQGDDRAYDRMIDALREPIYHYALRLCRDSAAAEDLTQETFLAVWQGISSFRGRSRFTTWVFAIAYRQYLRLRERRLIETVPLEESDMPSHGEDPWRIAEKLDEKERLRRVVDSLGEIYREAVHLVHIQGFTYREASQILHIPIGTLKSRMNQAFNIMREQLGESEAISNETECSEVQSG